MVDCDDTQRSNTPGRMSLRILILANQPDHYFKVLSGDVSRITREAGFLEWFLEGSLG